MEVRSLHVYPIKSCRGISLEEVEVQTAAMKDDRRFLVVDGEGRFLSQRNVPRMAHVEPRVAGDALEFSMRGKEPLRIVTTRDGEPRETSIWGNACQVVDQGDEAARWLEDVLGRPCRLVQMAGGYERAMHQQLAGGPTGKLHFADAAPLLVTSEASLEDLNARLDAPVPMERFRPNLVVRGCDAYAEDTWPRIRVGDVALAPLTPCGRCVITTTDQETLARSKEPLRTLATYRRHEDLGALFGMYYLHQNEGMIRVGDAVRLG